MCVQPPDDSVLSQEPTRSPEDNTVQPSVNDDDEDEDEVDEQWPAVVQQPKVLPPRQNKCPDNFVETPYVDVVSFSHYHIHAFMLVVSIIFDNNIPFDLEKAK